MASRGPASGDASAGGPATSSEVLEQAVLGSRRLSNLLVATAVSIGGLGFLLTSASSRLGRDLLPIGHPAELTWVPQGLVMGLYGIAAVLLATYLWGVIAIDVGSGSNRFDRSSGQARISRQAFRQRIDVDIPLREIQAVKVEVRDVPGPAAASTMAGPAAPEGPVASPAASPTAAETAALQQTLARIAERLGELERRLS